MRSDLDAYLDALYLERGLSEATLRAYRVDLEGVSAYARSLDKTIEALTDADINGFIGSLFSKGLRIPSIQRKLSALRGFYKYQIRHGRREDDPMARIQRPSKGRSLPAHSQRVMCSAYSRPGYRYIDWFKRQDDAGSSVCVGSSCH